jgi:hypothetical protein
VVRDQQTVVPDQTKAALDRIADAAGRVPCGRQALVTALQGGLDDLQDAVDEARALGIAWQSIEDALGIWGAPTSTDSRNSGEPADVGPSGNVIAITTRTAVTQSESLSGSAARVGTSERIRRSQLRLVQLTLDRCRRIRRVGSERLERASARA